MMYLLTHWPAVSTAFLAQKKAKDKLKVGLGTLLFPRQTARWLRFLHSHPGMAGLARANPRLLYKIYRPYLSNRLACGARVDLLIGHYGLLFDAGARPILEAAARRPLALATVQGKDESQYSLHLSAINDGHREGDGVALYSLSFTLAQENGRRYIKIGSLQGIRSEHGAQWIRQATRNLHGCRPKNLLVAVVRDIGAYFACAGTILVSNRNRVAINWQRRRRILADYDDMWREMHASERPDGDFALSCSGILPVDFDGVPSKKRSEAKKRAALQQSIFDAARECLDALRGVAIALPKAAPCAVAGSGVMLAADEFKPTA